VFVVGDGIEEAEDVFSGLFVEAVEDDGVGVLGGQRPSPDQSRLEAG
jgi:hypothetical protein